MSRHIRLTRLSRRWQPDKIHGLVFDGVMLLANFSLLRALLASPIEQMTDRQIGVLLAIGITAHFLGALPKIGPLQYRLERFHGRVEKHRVNFLGCLSFLHFLFFLIVTAMTLGLLGFVDLSQSGSSREWIWVLISMVVAGLTTGTVWLAIGSPGSKPISGLWWSYQEIPADLLLWFSATVLTRFFWQGLLLESEPPHYMGFTVRAAVYVAATSLLFLIFYLPARLLFLAEDYKYPFTWLRLWLVATFPMLTIVFIQ